MESGFSAPAMLPDNGSITRRFLPSLGFAGRVPRVRQYYEALRFPAALPATLRFLRTTVTIPSRLCSCLRQVRRQLAARKFRAGTFPEPDDEEMETAGRPKFLGNPDVPAPCSRTPARPTLPGHTVARHGPTHSVPRGLSTRGNFGAQSHG